MTSLSHASDISFNTIKRLWKNPYSGVNMATLHKIAKVLQVEINELTVDEEE